MNRIVLAFAYFLCAAVGSAQTTPQPAKSVSERLSAIEARLDGADSWMQTMLAFTGDRSVVLDCDTGKFTGIMPTANTLVFLVSCTKIEPYLEGYRISLSLGNTSSMQFSGVTAELGYGETFAKTFTQHISVSTTNPLVPGLWNQIQATINPVAAKDVRVIRFYDFNFSTAKGAPF